LQLNVCDMYPKVVHHFLITLVVRKWSHAPAGEEQRRLSEGASHGRPQRHAQ
jgi:hypothetical protein